MVSKIISRLNLDSTWQLVDLKEFNDCYLIAIKEKETKLDTIKVDSVRKILFELGIDSGIKGKPLTIQYVNVDFSDITSGSNELNAITAFIRLTHLPNQFYIRAISVDNGLERITKGTAAISVNINAVNLG